MSQELALPTPQVLATERGVKLSSLGEMREWAQVVINAKLAPAAFQSPDAVMVAIQHGMELGLSPMQALHSIAIINGKPGIYGDAALALCKCRPDFADIHETFERGEGDENMFARCVVTRAGQTPVTRTFSVAEAKKAGLWGKSGPWSQYPKRMLQMRARSFALRDSFPDALKGIGIREEVEDIPTKPASIREIPTETLRFAGEPEPAPQLADKAPEPTHEPSDNDLANEDLFK